MGFTREDLIPTNLRLAAANQGAIYVAGRTPITVLHMGGRDLWMSFLVVENYISPGSQSNIWQEKDIGFTDLISRIPSGKALPISHYDEEFVVAKINKINKSLNPSENPSETRTYVTTDDDQMGQIYLGEEELKVKRVSFVETSFKIWILQEQLWKF